MSKQIYVKQKTNKIKNKAKIKYNYQVLSWLKVRNVLVSVFVLPIGQR